MYKLSFFISLFLIFQLQVLSYIIWYLTNEGLINGVLDKYLLFKSPLIIIPITFLLYSIYGLFNIEKNN